MNIEEPYSNNPEIHKQNNKGDKTKIPNKENKNSKKIAFIQPEGAEEIIIATSLITSIKNLYPDYDIYMCIQDSLIINKPIDLSIINNTNAYTFHTPLGFYSHLHAKPVAIELLKDVNLNYKDIIDTDFIIAQHSSFIVNNYVMKNIFETFIHPPINKDGSCAYERIFGMYFILKNIKTEDMNTYFRKYSGSRV